MKHSWLLIPALIGFASSVAAQQTPVYALADGFDDLLVKTRKVRDAHQAHLSPLFDGAPYLNLRPGDQLVRARIDPDGHFMRFSGPQGKDTFEYFVRSKGKYFLLATVWSSDQDGKPFCGAEDSLLFDWKLTIENARKLRDLWLSQHAVPLSTEQYEAVVRAVRKECPEIHVEPDSGVEEDYLVSIASHDFAVLQGRAYDRLLDCVYRYTMKVGPGVFTVRGEAFVQGPPFVDRNEFESGEVAGLPPSMAVDPKTARRKRATFDKMLKFQVLIEQIIQPKVPQPL